MNWILIWVHKLPLYVITGPYKLTCSDAELVSPKGMIDGQWKPAKWQAGHPRMSYLFSQWASEL